MSDYEDLTTHMLRQAAMNAVLGHTHEDLVSHYLAYRTGDDAQFFGDRIYARLEALPARDLALAVVIALDDAARAEANRLWQHLWSDRAEDIS